MAQHLAEAICDLLDPPRRPCFIRLVAKRGRDAITHLLHVKPRKAAASLDVAVYSGEVENDDGTWAVLSRQGTQYSVSGTQDGLERFVADLVATIKEECGEWPCKLDLTMPFDFSGASTDWDSVELELLLPSSVQPGPAEGIMALQPHQMRVLLPALGAELGSSAIAAAVVYNSAAAYGRAQGELRYRHEFRVAAARRAPAAASAAAGASGSAAVPTELELPDSPEDFERKYQPQRDAAMDRLRAALLSMLRQALRNPRLVELEFEGAAAEQAGAANQPAGQPAA